MIREADSLYLGAISGPHYLTGEPAASAMVPVLPAVEAESTEREINRLTWAVLDGHASLADRQRLADLVNRQHTLRRRNDR